MRKVFKKLLEILDDTPAVYGKRQRGQSVLELALVSPLIVILLAGLAEIGWFAQNYLTIMEVTRVGARTGTVQDGATHPLYWEDPDNGLLLQASTPVTAAAPGDPGYIAYATWVAYFRSCDPSDGVAIIGFYNFLGCVMTRSMDPLEFHGDDPDELINPDTNRPYPDDIIISAFSVRTIDNPALLPADIRNDIEWPLANPDLVRFGNPPDPDTPQAIVVGRYPSNVNECAGDRDPFDYIQDGDNLTTRNVDGQDYVLELHREDEDGTLIPYADDNDSENQRGFVWAGQHRDPATGCLGSDWSIQDVERLINLQGFELNDGQRTYVPSQGLVLVEMFWHHETLSQFVGLAPVLSPVFAILGTETTISVWAAFPLPQVEPRIEFPATWED